MSDISSSSKRTILVAVTGGIGSGKTTVSQCFMDLNVPCFCADSVAGSYYGDRNFCRQVAGFLGSGVLNADGSADKKKIAEIVFNDAEKLQALNDFVHPRVLEDFKQWTLRYRNEPYVLFESAILFESRLQNNFDRVICVTAPLELRIRRILKRDGITAEMVESRIRNQSDEDFKKKNSDFVINNSRGEKYRVRCVQKIHNQLLKLSQNQ